MTQSRKAKHVIVLCHSFGAAAFSQYFETHGDMSVSAGVADIENKIILAEAPKGVLGISVHAAGRLALQQVLKHLEHP